MAKINTPTIIELTPDETKGHEQNLQEMFQYIANTTFEKPTKFKLQLVLTDVVEMSVEEVNKMVKQAEEDAAAMEARELVPHAIDLKDGQMTYKMKE